MASTSLRRAVLIFQRIILVFLPPTIWMGLIFLLSAQSTLPSPHEPLYNFILKKTAHVFVYAVLWLLLHRAFILLTHPQYSLKLLIPKNNFGQLYRSTRYWLLPLCLAMLYAATDEYHQTFIPGRTGTINDLGFDLLGVVLAVSARYTVLDKIIAKLPSKFWSVLQNSHHRRKNAKI